MTSHGGSRESRSEDKVVMSVVGRYFVDLLFGRFIFLVLENIRGVLFIWLILMVLYYYCFVLDSYFKVYVT